MMPRPQKNSLRQFTIDARTQLERLSRSQTAPAAHVARAKALLAVATGHCFTEAAQAAGRRSGDAVAQLVARFNHEGVAAVEPGHGGGQPKRYTHDEQARILQEVGRVPDREQDGTATWSLVTLQRALRQAPDGLPGISTATIWGVLHEAGFRWGKDRSWCQTGTALRRRKSGPVTVLDPDAGAKNLDRGCLPSTTSRSGRKTRRTRTRPAPIPDSTGTEPGSQCGTHPSMRGRAPRSN